jgi:hypothetical protein
MTAEQSSSSWRTNPVLALLTFRRTRDAIKRITSRSFSRNRSKPGSECLPPRVIKAYTSCNDMYVNAIFLLCRNCDVSVVATSVIRCSFTVHKGSHGCISIGSEYQWVTEIIGLEARILKATKQAPPDGSTHWSTRKLAGYLGVGSGRDPTPSTAPLYGQYRPGI